MLLGHARQDTAQIYTADWIAQIIEAKSLAIDLAQSRDSAIWARAASLGAVIFAKDEDFAQLTLAFMRPETHSASR